MTRKLIIIFLNLFFFCAAGYVLIDEFFRDRSVEWRNRPFMDNEDLVLLVAIFIGSLFAFVRQFIGNRSRSGFVTVLVGVFINSLVLLYSILNLMIGLFALIAFVVSLGMMPIFLIGVCMGVMGWLTLQEIYKRERALAE